MTGPELIATLSGKGFVVMLSSGFGEVITFFVMETDEPRWFPYTGVKLLESG